MTFHLKEGNICHCGVKVDEATSTSQCHFECFNENCNAYVNKAYAVFSLLQNVESLVGCFTEDTQTQSDANLSSFSFQSCLNHCRNENLTFMVINKSKNICSCLTSVNFQEQVDIDHCTERCDGAKHCGGPAHVAVYKVQSHYNYFTNYEKLNFCLNSNNNNIRVTCNETTGVCNNHNNQSSAVTVPSNKEESSFCKPGVCEKGWKGILCTERDCKANNGNCLNGSQCFENELDKDIVFSECICSKKRSINQDFRCQDSQTKTDADTLRLPVSMGLTISVLFTILFIKNICAFVISALYSLENRKLTAVNDPKQQQDRMRARMETLQLATLKRKHLMKPANIQPLTLAVPDMKIPTPPAKTSI
ncbi:hypothetical protein HELRODRAFT_179328 [Helobdella robusta]|uniref:WSC domain-containing protein n=1 Tax=Helobdella robusta TaxID=6412 RepID=T1FEK1_HELRO|nr:hypothetical protein HELRODRAFT_179328 [Helobdella robusta]ESN95552.1 hypothetical protein HELRODRAFT_179328 [Helobdella robusta]